MLFTILLTLKILLFMNITKVRYNGAIVFIISTSIISLFFILIYFSNNKKKDILAFSFHSIVSLIMFVDVMYYTYFNSLPSVNMIKQIGQLSAVGDSIQSILSFKNILFLLDIPFIGAWCPMEWKWL